MLSEILVGGHQDVLSGSTVKARGGRTGEVMVSQARGKYHDAVVRGNVYIGANALGTAVTTQAGLSATTPALTLYNPVGSGVFLSMLRASIGITASPAAATIFCLAHNTKNATAPATTTDATMINAMVGSTAVPKGRCYRVATLAAAPIANLILGGPVGASAISGLVQDFDLAGLLVIEEGVAVSIQTTAAAAIVASFVWEETPR